MSEITTVLGPIDSSKLGFTLMHEHIFLDARVDVWLHDRLLADKELAYQELILYKQAGGTTIVDQTNGGLRGTNILRQRHPLEIQEISRKTGINIILGSGWYREPYYDKSLWRLKTDEISEQIINEINVGIEGTQIKSGIIGEIGAHFNYISPVEERVLRAAARAQKKTGLAISTHQGAGIVALDQLDILEEEGVDLRTVIISHANINPDHDYHMQIINRGAFVSFEGIGTKNSFESKREMQLIGQIIASGNIDHLLLSHDVCVKPMYVAYGGGGYEYIPKTWLEMMRQDLSISDEEIDQIMIYNPQHALKGER
ncbi:MAG: hypothetical protein FI718_01425 [SAR202 cluster bacterium]|nr:hypothetical protein [SAR202 cluster bacterium]|tara:strand:- start:1334 stop:2275 length:942 start_codon:yes stop_codon:yes gene_type:complete